MAYKIFLLGSVIAVVLLLLIGLSKESDDSKPEVEVVRLQEEKQQNKSDDTDSAIKIIHQWIPSKCERKAKSGDFVRYHYYGMLEDGKHFDNSYLRGGTYNTFVDSGWLIPGMDQALIGMCLNEHRIVSIPSHLAYGDIGTDGIPGGATIFFNFILLDISNQADTVQVTTAHLPENCERKLENTDFVRYHYTGYLLNGEEFHSSYDAGRSYDTYVGEGYLIRGMDIGLIGSCMGEKRWILIPPHLAYGDRGDGMNIPPSASIKFEVEVLDFHNPRDQAKVVTLETKFGKGDEESCPRQVKETDFVRYHYNGTLVDGTVFDSSYSRGVSYDTYVGLRQLIRGVDQGLLGTCVGETRRIIVPPHLGYGEPGVDGAIPGSAVIIFDLYMIDIHNPKDDVNITVLKEPTEDCQRKVKDNDFLTIEYHLELMDGSQLDSSEDHPGTFSTYNRLGSLVLGLHKGVKDMCVGEIRKLVIPPHLGYGEPGTEGIPGSAVLVYTIELKKIEDPLPDGVLFVWAEGKSQPDDLLNLTDDDSDGKVTVDELMSYILKEVDDGNAKLIPGVEREKTVEELFKLMDENEDGFLEENEMIIPDRPKNDAAKDEL